MKNMKKLLALALALLMLLSLSACGGFEMRMARAASRMSKLESVHTDAVVTADVNLSLMGSSSAMEAKMELSADTQKEPLLAAGQLNAGVYGISKELGFYAERSGDSEISVYLSTDGGQNWETNTLDMENASFELDLSAQLKAMAGMAALFTETGKETVNGVAAVGYAGEIPAETVKQAIEQADVKEKLEETFDVELADDCFADVGPIPVTIALAEKSNDILRVTMDLSQVVSEVLGQVLNQVLNSGDLSLLGGLGLEVSVDNVQLTVAFSQFDAVTVSIPENVKG